MRLSLSYPKETSGHMLGHGRTAKRITPSFFERYITDKLLQKPLMVAWFEILYGAQGETQ